MPHPLSNDCMFKITGPAIVTAPDGAVWCRKAPRSNLAAKLQPAGPYRVVRMPSWRRGACARSMFGGNGTIVRIDPKTEERCFYQLPLPKWLKTMRFIHMAFHTVAESPFFYQQGTHASTAASMSAAFGSPAGELLRPSNIASP